MIRVSVLFMICYLNVFAMEIKNIVNAIDKMNATPDIVKTIQYKLYDPFSAAKPLLNKKYNYSNGLKHPSQSIILQTTLNKRAFIGGKWYNKGDIVNGFRIRKIYTDSIVITKNSKMKIVRLKMVKNILKMKEQ